MRIQILQAAKIVIVTFLFSVAIMPLMKKIALHIGAVDIPRNDEEHRHIHNKTMPKLGGVGIFLGFLFGYMLFGTQSVQMNSILIASFIMILTGIIDDVKSIVIAVHSEWFTFTKELISCSLTISTSPTILTIASPTRWRPKKVRD